MEELLKTMVFNNIPSRLLGTASGTVLNWKIFKGKSVPVLNLPPNLHPEALATQRLLHRIFYPNKWIRSRGDGPSFVNLVRRSVEMFLNSNAREIVDELYMQLLRLTFAFISTNTIHLCFEVSRVMLNFLAPSRCISSIMENFFNFFQNFVDSSNQGVIKNCLKCMEIIQTYGSRQTVPSIKEIACTIEGRTFPIQVFFQSGNSCVCEINPLTSVKELIQMINSNFGIKENTIFACHRRDSHGASTDSEVVLHEKIGIMHTYVSTGYDLESSSVDLSSCFSSFFAQKKTKSEPPIIVFRPRSRVDLGVLIKYDDLPTVRNLYRNARCDVREGNLAASAEDHAYLAALAVLEGQGGLVQADEDADYHRIRKMLWKVAPLHIIGRSDPSTAPFTSTGIHGDDRTSTGNELSARNLSSPISLEAQFSAPPQSTTSILPTTTTSTLPTTITLSSPTSTSTTTQSSGNCSPAFPLGVSLPTAFESLVLGRYSALRRVGFVSGSQARLLYVEHVWAAQGKFVSRSFDVVATDSITQPRDAPAMNSLRGPPGQAGVAAESRRTLIVDRYGLSLLDIHCTKLLEFLPFEHLIGWGFNDASLAIRHDSARLYRFQTVQGEEISDVLEGFYRQYKRKAAAAAVTTRRGSNHANKLQLITQDCSL